jgi:RNA polymerase sigma-70 factor (ECF subfamily)
MADTASIASGVQAAGSGAGGLLTQAAAGDRLAFAQLALRHQDRVTKLAYRLLGWRGEVEDVVQDVFVAVLRNLPCFRGESQFTTWLYRITVNECRRARRKRLLRLSFWRSHPVSAQGAEHDSIRRKETSEQVRSAVRSLPAHSREVVVLRYLEELPIVEIGRILGLRPNAVEVRLSRARRQLQAALGGLLET